MISNLRALREQQKISQRQLAKIIKVSNGTISLLENNNRSGNIKTLKKLAEYFNIPLEDLFG